MKKLILIIGITFCIQSCEKNEDSNNDNYPDCLQFEINNIFDGEPTTIRANLKKYKYQENIVYVFFEGNVVEGQTRVYSTECTKICEYGGIGGNQNNTCNNWESAELIETVWTDNR
ncbi:DUF6970 domain-containing protein [Tenacibaculum soleae]|uniref:DUF6970 domain-containing protein n=1 Tax=Tenacibaculum soleae TaxID=447689 RepID=UPI002300A201|nr:hypothetical protein [Tenacibaculum soleae]